MGTIDTFQALGFCFQDAEYMAWGAPHLVEYFIGMEAPNVQEKIEVAREFVREGWDEQADAVAAILAAAEKGDYAAILKIRLEY